MSEPPTSDDTPEVPSAPSSGAPPVPPPPVFDAPTQPLTAPPSAFPPPPPMPPPDGGSDGERVGSARRRRGGLIAAIVAAVVIVLIVVLVAVSTGSGGTSATNSPSPAQAAKVTTFSATAASPVEVDLSWSATGPVTQTQFSIARDGTPLTTVSGGVAAYNDTTVTPKKSYTYTIQTVDAKGHQSSPTTATVTTPPPPPLAQARVEGSWLLRETYLSENFTNKHVGQVEKEGWVLTPKCADGPCTKVRLKMFRPGSKPTLLARKGADYHGTGTDTLGECSGVHLKDTLAIVFHVTRAHYVDGKWMATGIAGTIDTTGQPSSQCVTGSSKQSFNGHPQG